MRYLVQGLGFFLAMAFVAVLCYMGYSQNAEGYFASAFLVFGCWGIFALIVLFG